MPICHVCRRSRSNEPSKQRRDTCHMSKAELMESRILDPLESKASEPWTQARARLALVALYSDQSIERDREITLVSRSASRAFDTWILCLYRICGCIMETPGDRLQGFGIYKPNDSASGVLQYSSYTDCYGDIWVIATLARCSCWDLGIHKGDFMMAWA